MMSQTKSAWLQLREKLLSPRHLPRLVAVVALGLAVLAAWDLWQKLSPAHDTQATAFQDRPTQTPLEYIQSQALSSKVAQQHLFGTADPQVRSMDSQLMDVSLDGTIYDSADSSASLALLRIDGQEKAYSLGDTLPDGEKLTGISADGIQLERYGENRSIPLAIKRADADSHFETLGLLAQAGQNPGIVYAPGATTARSPSIAMPTTAPIPADPLLGTKLLSVKDIRRQRRMRFQGIAPGKP